MEDPTVWNDRERAQALGRDKASLEGVVLAIDSLTTARADAQVLLDMAKEEDDEETLEVVIEDVASYEAQVSGLEFRRMFSGELDANDCFLDIQSGSGGTEAQDWAEMILRMYLRWAEAKGFKTEILEASAGDVAGIKSATIKISGDYAYGLSLIHI